MSHARPAQERAIGENALRLSRLSRLIPAVFGFALGAIIQVPGPREAEKNACVWIGSIFPGVAENCFHGWIIYLVATAFFVGGIIWFLWPEQSRATLKIAGPILSPDHLGHDRWRVRVSNQGPATANNVQMRLTEISPRPRYGRWQADYPYEVERVGKTFSDPPSRINCGDTEDFEFKTWQGEDGNIYTSLDTKDTPPLYRLVIEPDETWQLRYEVTAENAHRVSFLAKVSVRDGRAIVEQIE